jgi:hypothetical protein
MAPGIPQEMLDESLSVCNNKDGITYYLQKCQT